MTINRRRAPSSKVSSDKKIDGHKREADYATLINGEKLKGTQKGDVKDENNYLHSVKSGKKWQVFLYGFDRISKSSHLNILKPCLEAFPKDSKTYFEDRIKCISYKENFLKKYGSEAAKKLSNQEVIDELGANTYIKSKEELSFATLEVFNALQDKKILRNFLGEALFNNGEVKFLAIKDSTYRRDDLFKVFCREDVIDIFTAALFPASSVAGRVSVDYNVAGQKTLLRYKKTNPRTKKISEKNIVEIEIRNDSDKHYRQVRFNMLSKDALFLLLNQTKPLDVRDAHEGLKIYGGAIKILKA
jgi:hypothetical protein